MTFEDQKSLADFHFVLGVTFMCQHLTLYTMKGDGKRDFPPTFSYHQPYWKYYKAMNDYLSRCGVATSAGEFHADVLLLHPVASLWCDVKAGDSAGRQEGYYDKSLKTMENLLGLQRDFDFGDETILSRHGRLTGKEIRVGKMKYKIIVVPPSINWSSETFDLLSSFKGKIVFIGETPSLLTPGSTRAGASFFGAKTC